MQAISTRTKRVQLILGVIAIVVIYAALLYAGKLKSTRHEHASISAREIAERAAPLCRMLCDTNLPLVQTVEERIIRHKDGKPHTAWAVECGNPDGEHFARTIWDAQTGELIYAIHMAKRSAIGQSPELPARGAADVAWHWMSTLGVAGIAQHWNVKGTPQLINNSWRVMMRSANATATVVFDSDTRNLIYINIMRDGFASVVS